MKNTTRCEKYLLKSIIYDDFPLFFFGDPDSANHILHEHDFIELVIVEHGKGIHFTEDSNYSIVAGDVLAIPKGMKHGYREVENLSITNIYFDMSLLNSHWSDFGQIPGFSSLFLLTPLSQKRLINKKGFLTLHPEEVSYVKQLVTQMISELQEKATGYRSSCMAYLVNLIVFLSRRASKHILTYHHVVLHNVLSYMEKHYIQNISLEQLAATAKMSVRNLHRTFKNYTGVTPLMYLINLRLQHAREMLVGSDLSIAEIAIRAGFGDSAYFTRQFKKKFHQTPLIYRRSSALPTNSPLFR